MNVLRNLGHVTAVGRLVKDDVDLVERGDARVAIAHVTVDKLGAIVDPCGLSSLVRLRLEIVENAHGPALAHEKIDDVGADEPHAAGDKRAFTHATGRLALRLLW